MAALNKSGRIVIKIGSALLVDPQSGELREEWLNGLAADVAELRASGADVAIVSSGSIALGRRVLGLAPDDLALEQSQAAAAVGQIRLAGAYQSALQPHGIKTAQVLVTLEDSNNRRRYLNSRATLATLLRMGVVPIVNENDTVATDEIRFGDNDRLAAQVAVTIGADQLILLSDVDGLYTAPPGANSNAEHLSEVQRITPDIENMAGEAGSGVAKGGMRTKIWAAKTATGAGCEMAITNGMQPRPVAALRNGARATWFLAETDPQAARKRWIAAMKSKGSLIVDAGAVEALNNGRSLLPAGVTDVVGDFGRGDPVTIVKPDGNGLGQGLARYTASEARLIKGLRSGDIESVLGYPARAALIHRDDMVI